MLVVDATQGVEAQTVANAYLAVDNDLEIIPVVNKIDLPASDVPEAQPSMHRDSPAPRRRDHRRLRQDRRGRAGRARGDRGAPPPPEGDPAGAPRALIFDSEYDVYRGVVAYVRIVDGSFSSRELIEMLGTGDEDEDRASSATSARR